ncbi:hypothetical protein MKX03_030708 [Papaver bracteatum]|nr:hypothetical protein MKX03_030708 [Papaver bracteatum]
MGLGFIVGATGILNLSHVAYFSILKEEFLGPLLKIVAKLLIGLVLCMYAGLCVLGKFLSVYPDSDENMSKQIWSSSNSDFLFFKFEIFMLSSF